LYGNKQTQYPMKVLSTVLGLAMTFTLFSCSESDCQEHKKEDCVVTYELNPVCGCNGKTYDNPSVAQCHGIDDYEPGACDSKNAK